MGTRKTPVQGGTCGLRYRQTPITVGATGRLEANPAPHVGTVREKLSNADQGLPTQHAAAAPATRRRAWLVLCQKGRFVADSGNPNENIPSTDAGENGAVTSSNGECSKLGSSSPENFAIPRFSMRASSSRRIATIS